MTGEAFRKPRATDPVPTSVTLTLAYDFGDVLAGDEIVNVSHELVPFVGTPEEAADHGIAILTLLEQHGFLHRG